MSADRARAGYRQIGLLVNGIEFVPQDIAEKHMPFAVPPEVTIQAVYVREDDDG